MGLKESLRTFCHQEVGGRSQEGTEGSGMQRLRGHRWEVCSGQGTLRQGKGHLGGVGGEGRASSRARASSRNYLQKQSMRETWLSCCGKSTGNPTLFPSFDPCDGSGPLYIPCNTHCHILRR